MDCDELSLADSSGAELTSLMLELLLPCGWKSLMSVACLVFPFSLLWPTLLTCSGRASVTDIRR